MAGRPKGSINKQTQTKRKIQDEMKNKPQRKKRVVAPKGIITIPGEDNYRIAEDPLNYILERKRQKDDLPAEQEREVIIEDDEEIEIESAEPDADRWVRVGCFSHSELGLAEACRDYGRDRNQRKYRGKAVDLKTYVDELLEIQNCIKNSICK